VVGGIVLEPSSFGFVKAARRRIRS